MKGNNLKYIRCPWHCDTELQVHNKLHVIHSAFALTLVHAEVMLMRCRSGHLPLTLNYTPAGSHPPECVECDAEIDIKHVPN